MSLTLGKSFDRSYGIRLPFLDGFYHIGVFFNKKSPFLLLSVNSDFQEKEVHGIKINMFKNLVSSTFVETFLDLHNYRKQSLDIINQFQGVKSEYYYDVNYLFNETIRLARIEVDNRVLYDSLTLYGFSLAAFSNESIFVIAERQNIVKKLEKKLVRTTGIQIATSRALKLIEEFHKESKESNKFRHNIQNSKINPNEVISLDDIEDDLN